jgi:hypothetical protein
MHEHNQNLLDEKKCMRKLCNKNNRGRVQCTQLDNSRPRIFKLFSENVRLKSREHLSCKKKTEMENTPARTCEIK